MADIFVSYANEDRERTSKLVGALEACGWSVWWDRRIVAGQPFDQVIEHELQTARCVIVLWSKHSIASEWVKSEASVAAERGVLVPALIDRVELPLEFRRKQTADLVGWDGDTSGAGFQALSAGVAGRASRNSAPVQPRPLAGSEARFAWNRGWILVVITAIAVALSFAVYWGSISRSAVFTDQEPASPLPGKHGELADLVVGIYHGAVVSDAKGSSRSDVTVTVSKVSSRRVRITSDYERLGTVEVELTRALNSVISAGGNARLFLELDKKPPLLSYNPDGSVAYGGQKQ